MRRLSAGTLVVLALAAGFVLAPSADAATFTVTNVNDAGAGSLRQAITNANANGNAPAADVITISASGTVQLQSALPEISEPVQINGPGADILTVRRDSGPDYRIFTITANDAAIRGTTVLHGRGLGNGGGIFAANDLTLERVALVGNAGFNAGNSGGGAFVTNGLTMRQSTVSDNFADTDGGGLAFAFATIENSTISANVAGDEGGGVYVAGTGTLIRSTTMQNSAREGKFDGGDNIYSVSVGGVVLRNTLLNGNDPLVDDCAGAAMTSDGFNLSEDASCNLAQSSDQPSTDPHLMPLANNGGPTKTHALGLDSPAVDKGLSNDINTDQRGSPRPVEVGQVPNEAGGNGADIGAYELIADVGFPETVITSKAFRRTTDRTPTFRFGANEPATFTCSIDGIPYTSCPSPHTLERLPLGTHRLSVRATDVDGNVDPTPATRTFKVVRRR